MRLNRADRRAYGPEMLAWIEQLEEIARSVGCTCGPMDCRPIPGKTTIVITHADSCPLPTDSFSPDGSRPA